MPLKTIHKELLARIVASGAMLERSERSANGDIERNGHFIQENEMALQEHTTTSNDGYTSTVYVSDVRANATKRQPHTNSPSRFTRSFLKENITNVFQKLAHKGGGSSTTPTTSLTAARHPLQI